MHPRRSQNLNAKVLLDNTAVSTRAAITASRHAKAYLARVCITPWYITRGQYMAPLYITRVERQREKQIESVLRLPRIDSDQKATTPGNPARRPDGVDERGDWSREAKHNTDSANVCEPRVKRRGDQQTGSISAQACSNRDERLKVNARLDDPAVSTGVIRREQER